MQRKISLLAMLLTFVVCSSTVAQNSDNAREVTDVFFIKNAFVVQKPGVVLAGTSVLIRNGLIADVGRNIKVPFDAKVIDADSMFVYAAFIDAAGHAGIPKPEKGDRPKVKDPGNPPNDIAGITPQVKAADQIKYDDKSISTLRKVGFGYFHVLPRGRMMPGSGVFMTAGQGTREQMLVKDNTAFFSQLTSARGVFPNTIIGVMSKYRDVYKNAKLTKTYRSAYERSPVGLQRPTQSEELLALDPVLSNSMPVFFNAQKVKDIYRVLTLQKELGFKLVLTNTTQANLLTSKLKALNSPVILSLELPKAEKDKTKKDKKTKSKGENEAKDKSKKDKKKKEVDPDQEKFELKKKKAAARYESQAIDMVNAGIPISFSTIDVKAKDIKTNINRMIAQGLTADQALAALTTNPASLLGVSNIAGTIEKGKMANVFICDTLYFQKESKIKYTLVDGSLHEYKESKKKSKGSTVGADLSGSWSYTLLIPGQETTGKMVVTKDGETYAVKIDQSSNSGDYTDATNVLVDNNNMTFDLSVNESGMTLQISGDMDFDGENFDGNMTISDLGTFPISGTKLNSPKR